MNTTAWRKLTKESFPDIVKEENIVYTDTNERYKRHSITYVGKSVYIIAIDVNHVPAWCNCYRTMIDDTHFICMFQAENTVTIDDETGKVMTEEKSFYSEDSEDYTDISVDDENLEYCRYKVMELEAISD